MRRKVSECIETAVALFVGGSVAVLVAKLADLAREVQ
jgi:hypothetical protein